MALVVGRGRRNDPEPLAKSPPRINPVNPSNPVNPVSKVWCIPGLNQPIAITAVQTESIEKSKTCPPLPWRFRRAAHERLSGIHPRLSSTTRWTKIRFVRELRFDWANIPFPPSFHPWITYVPRSLVSLR